MTSIYDHDLRRKTALDESDHTESYLLPIGGEKVSSSSSNQTSALFSVGTISLKKNAVKFLVFLILFLGVTGVFLFVTNEERSAKSAQKLKFDIVQPRQYVHPRDRRSFEAAAADEEPFSDDHVKVPQERNEGKKFTSIFRRNPIELKEVRLVEDLIDPAQLENVYQAAAEKGLYMYDIHRDMRRSDDVKGTDEESDEDIIERSGILEKPKPNTLHAFFRGIWDDFQKNFVNDTSIKRPRHSTEEFIKLDGTVGQIMDYSEDMPNNIIAPLHVALEIYSKIPGLPDNGETLKVITEKINKLQNEKFLFAERVAAMGLDDESNPFNYHQSTGVGSAIDKDEKSRFIVDFLSSKSFGWLRTYVKTNFKGTAPVIDKIEEVAAADSGKNESDEETKDYDGQVAGKLLASPNSVDRLVGTSVNQVANLVTGGDGEQIVSLLDNFTEFDVPGVSSLFEGLWNIWQDKIFSPVSSTIYEGLNSESQESIQRLFQQSMLKGMSPKMYAYMKNLRERRDEAALHSRDRRLDTQSNMDIIITDADRRLFFQEEAFRDMYANAPVYGADYYFSMMNGNHTVKDNAPQLHRRGGSEHSNENIFSFTKSRPTVRPLKAKSLDKPEPEVNLSKVQKNAEAAKATFDLDLLLKLTEPVTLQQEIAAPASDVVRDSGEKFGESVGEFLGNFLTDTLPKLLDNPFVGLLLHYLAEEFPAFRAINDLGVPKIKKLLEEFEQMDWKEKVLVMVKSNEGWAIINMVDGIFPFFKPLLEDILPDLKASVPAPQNLDSPELKNVDSFDQLVTYVSALRNSSESEANETLYSYQQELTSQLKDFQTPLNLDFSGKSVAEVLINFLFSNFVHTAASILAENVPFLRGILQPIIDLSSDSQLDFDGQTLVEVLNNFFKSHFGTLLVDYIEEHFPETTEILETVKQFVATVVKGKETPETYLSAYISILNSAVGQSILGFIDDHIPSLSPIVGIVVGLLDYGQTNDLKDASVNVTKIVEFWDSPIGKMGTNLLATQIPALKPILEMFGWKPSNDVTWRTIIPELKDLLEKFLEKKFPWTKKYIDQYNSGTPLTTVLMNILEDWIVSKFPELKTLIDDLRNGKGNPIKIILKILETLVLELGQKFVDSVFPWLSPYMDKLVQSILSGASVFEIVGNALNLFKHFVLHYLEKFFPFLDFIWEALEKGGAIVPTIIKAILHGIISLVEGFLAELFAPLEDAFKRFATILHTLVDDVKKGIAEILKLFGRIFGDDFKKYILGELVLVRNLVHVLSCNPLKSFGALFEFVEKSMILFFKYMFTSPGFSALTGFLERLGHLLKNAGWGSGKFVQNLVENARKFIRHFLCCQLQDHGIDWNSFSFLRCQSLYTTENFKSISYHLQGMSTESDNPENWLVANVNPDLYFGNFVEAIVVIMTGFYAEMTYAKHNIHQIELVPVYAEPADLSVELVSKNIANATEAKAEANHVRQVLKTLDESPIANEVTEKMVIEDEDGDDDVSDDDGSGRIRREDIDNFDEHVETIVFSEATPNIKGMRKERRGTKVQVTKKSPTAKITNSILLHLEVPETLASQEKESPFELGAHAKNVYDVLKKGKYNNSLSPSNADGLMADTLHAVQMLLHNDLFKKYSEDSLKQKFFNIFDRPVNTETKIEPNSQSVKVSSLTHSVNDILSRVMENPPKKEKTKAKFAEIQDLVKQNLEPSPKKVDKERLLADVYKAWEHKDDSLINRAFKEEVFSGMDVENDTRFNTDAALSLVRSIRKKMDSRKKEKPGEGLRDLTADMSKLDFNYFVQYINGAMKGPKEAWNPKFARRDDDTFGVDKLVNGINQGQAMDNTGNVFTTLSANVFEIIGDFFFPDDEKVSAYVDFYRGGRIKASRLIQVFISALKQRVTGALKGYVEKVWPDNPIIQKAFSYVLLGEGSVFTLLFSWVKARVIPMLFDFVDFVFPITRFVVASIADSLGYEKIDGQYRWTKNDDKLTGAHSIIDGVLGHFAKYTTLSFFFNLKNNNPSSENVSESFQIESDVIKQIDEASGDDYDMYFGSSPDPAYQKNVVRVADAISKQFGLKAKDRGELADDLVASLDKEEGSDTQKDPNNSTGFFSGMFASIKRFFLSKLEDFSPQLYHVIQPLLVMQIDFSGGFLGLIFSGLQLAAVKTDALAEHVVDKINNHDARYVKDVLSGYTPFHSQHPSLTDAEYTMLSSGHFESDSSDSLKSAFKNKKFSKSLLTAMQHGDSLADELNDLALADVDEGDNDITGQIQADALSDKISQKEEESILKKISHHASCEQSDNPDSLKNIKAEILSLRPNGYVAPVLSSYIKSKSLAIAYENLVQIFPCGKPREKMIAFVRNLSVGNSFLSPMLRSIERALVYVINTERPDLKTFTAEMYGQGGSVWDSQKGTKERRSLSDITDIPFKFIANLSQMVGRSLLDAIGLNEMVAQHVQDMLEESGFGFLFENGSLASYVQKFSSFSFGGAISNWIQNNAVKSIDDSFFGFPVLESYLYGKFSNNLEKLKAFWSFFEELLLRSVGKAYHAVGNPELAEKFVEQYPSMGKDAYVDVSEMKTKFGLDEKASVLSNVIILFDKTFHNYFLEWVNEHHPDYSPLLKNMSPIDASEYVEAEPARVLVNTIQYGLSFPPIHAAATQILDKNLPFLHAFIQTMEWLATGVFNIDTAQFHQTPDDNTKAIVKSISHSLLNNQDLMQIDLTKYFASHPKVAAFVQCHEVKRAMSRYIASSFPTLGATLRNMETFSPYLYDFHPNPETGKSYMQSHVLEMTAAWTNCTAEIEEDERTEEQISAMQQFLEESGMDEDSDRAQVYKLLDMGASIDELKVYIENNGSLDGFVPKPYDEYTEGSECNPSENSDEVCSGNGICRSSSLELFGNSYCHCKPGFRGNGCSVFNSANIAFLIQSFLEHAYAEGNRCTKVFTLPAADPNFEYFKGIYESSAIDIRYQFCRPNMHGSSSDFSADGDKGLNFRLENFDEVLKLEIIKNISASRIFFKHEVLLSNIQIDGHLQHTENEFGAGFYAEDLEMSAAHVEIIDAIKGEVKNKLSRRGMLLVGSTFDPIADMMEENGGSPSAEFDAIILALCAHKTTSIISRRVSLGHFLAAHLGGKSLPSHFAFQGPLGQELFVSHIVLDAFSFGSGDVFSIEQHNDDMNENVAIIEGDLNNFSVQNASMRVVMVDQDSKMPTFPIQGDIKFAINGVSTQVQIGIMKNGKNHPDLVFEGVNITVSSIKVFGEGKPEDSWLDSILTALMPTLNFALNTRASSYLSNFLNQCPVGTSGNFCEDISNFTNPHFGSGWEDPRFWGTAVSEEEQTDDEAIVLDDEDEKLSLLESEDEESTEEIEGEDDDEDEAEDEDVPDEIESSNDDGDGIMKDGEAAQAEDDDGDGEEDVENEDDENEDDENEDDENEDDKNENENVENEDEDVENEDGGYDASEDGDNDGTALTEFDGSDADDNDADGKDDDAIASPDSADDSPEVDDASADGDEDEEAEDDDGNGEENVENEDGEEGVQNEDDDNEDKDVENEDVENEDVENEDDENEDEGDDVETEDDDVEAENDNVETEDDDVETEDDDVETEDGDVDNGRDASLESAKEGRDVDDANEDGDNEDGDNDDEAEKNEINENEEYEGTDQDGNSDSDGKENNEAHGNGKVNSGYDAGTVSAKPKKSKGNVGTDGIEDSVQLGLIETINNPQDLNG